MTMLEQPIVTDDLTGCPVCGRPRMLAGQQRCDSCEERRLRPLLALREAAARKNATLAVIAAASPVRLAFCRLCNAQAPSSDRLESLERGADFDTYICFGHTS